jgi:hypothetical protein
MSYWKTIITDNLRVYFPVKSGGSLVTGLNQLIFTSILINPEDSASFTGTVLESTQRPGIYYTDIDSTFLITHGSGMYGLSLGVHKPAPQKLDDEVLFSIDVTEGDLESISNKITELHRIHGLELDSPLTVNQNERTAGSIVQTITYDNDSKETIVTRI